MIKLLSMFITNLLPFKLVEDPAFRELALLENGCVKKGYTICQKILVSWMESYYQIFEEEMQGVLEKTSQINLLLDLWTSVNGKSYLSILSFCPNLNVAENSNFAESSASQRNLNPYIIAFHDVSHERHTAAYLKEIILLTLADKKLQHKMASVTFDDATNNVKMMEMIATDLTGEGVNEIGRIVKMRCLSAHKARKHVKNSLRSAEISVAHTKLFEFDQFNRKPVETDVYYTEYWLDNQLKYPKLSRLALSLYNSKLSTADIERCFSISKTALTGRYCVTNENLKRSMILRNRWICFGIRRHFTNDNFFCVSNSQ